MPIDRKFRLARMWSNAELRKIAHFFSGDVVNVSAGDDLDKEGGRYHDYFAVASSYSLTNYSPGSFRGFEGRPGEILLDLRGEVPEDLMASFDVVFNHTTLEHIFEVGTAFRNLCVLSRDIVIVVVPFAQVQHENEGYEDFWRFTPTCLRRLFQDQGFKVVYESANNDFNAATYLFFVASKQPERWAGKFPQWMPLNRAAEWIGGSNPEGEVSKSRISRFWFFCKRSLVRIFSPQTGK